MAKSAHSGHDSGVSGKVGSRYMYVDVANITLIKTDSGPSYKNTITSHLPPRGDLIRFAVKKQWAAATEIKSEWQTIYNRSADGALVHMDEVYQPYIDSMGSPGDVHYDLFSRMYGRNTYYAGPMSHDGGTMPWIWCHFSMDISEPQEMPLDALLPSLYTRRELVDITADLLPFANSPLMTPAGAYDTVSTRTLWIQQFRSIFMGGDIYFNSEKKDSLPGVVKKKFLDTVFDYKKPLKLNGPGSKSSNALQNSQVARSHSIYNFYIPSYERAISATEVLEGWLPNLHAFLSERWSANLDSDHSIFDKLIKLGGLLNEMFTDVLNAAGEKIGEKDFGQYFERWAEIWESVGVSGISEEDHLIEEFSELAVRYFHVVFPTDHLGELIGFNDKGYVFPMAHNIEFSTDGQTRFAQLLTELQLSSLLQAEIVKDNRPLDAAGDLKIPFTADFLNNAAKKFEQQSEMPLVSNFDDYDYIHKQDGDPTKIRGNDKVRSMDLTEWIEEYMPLKIDPSAGTILSTNPLSDIPEEMMTEIATFLGTRSEEAMAFYQSSDAGTLLAMVLSLFNGSMQQIFKHKNRSWKEVLDGKLAYSEAVCYRIQKLRGETTVQNFYFGKNDKIDFIEFMDTQIKYNTPYTYKVFVYQAVFGTEYEYRNLQISGAPEKISAPSTSVCSSKDYESWYDKFIGEKPAIYGDQAAQDQFIKETGCEGFKWAPDTGNGRGDGASAAPGEGAGTLNLGDRNMQIPRERLGARMEVYTRPKVFLVELPYVDFPNMRVHDYPPLPPQIKIFPYYSINNKIQIHLSPGSGEAKLKPQIIEANDIDCFRNVMLQQKLQDPEMQKILERISQTVAATKATEKTLAFGGTATDTSEAEYYSGGMSEEELLKFIRLKFKTDDFLAGYDVYRLTKKPTRYEDFAGHRVGRLSCDVDPKVSGINQYLFFEDRVTPNTKYYYTFRAIDIHGHVSNPTHVFEVEMVDDAGTVWQKIDVIEFEESKPSQPTRPAKRFMEVKPTEVQTILNLTMDDLVNFMKGSVDGDKTMKLLAPGAGLGNAESPVWNRKFKVRLISRDTGKKIDLNLNYTYKFKGNDVIHDIGDIATKLTAKGVKISTLTMAQQVAQALANECPDPTGVKNGRNGTAAVPTITGYVSDYSGGSTEAMAHPGVITGDPTGDY
jgi:hypothetical protein